MIGYFAIIFQALRNKAFYFMSLSRLGGRGVRGANGLLWGKNKGFDIYIRAFCRNVTGKG